MSKRLPPRRDYQPDLFAANFADIPDPRPARHDGAALLQPGQEAALHSDRVPCRRRLGRSQRKPEIRDRDDLGRRHPDLGIHPDHRGARPRPDPEPNHPLPPAQPAEIDPPADRRRALQAPPRRPRPADPYRRPDQHPRARARRNRHPSTGWKAGPRTSTRKPARRPA